MSQEIPLSNNAVRLGFVASIAFTLSIAIIVTGFVLGEPTLLIPGQRQLARAEAEAQAQKERAEAAEHTLWIKEHPARD